MNSKLWLTTAWEGKARDARFCVEELARQREVSVRTLRRFLTQRFGVCPKEWLRDLRMQQAARLLTEGKRAYEIANELSYGSSSQFSRAFKAYYGAGPRDYLKRLPRGSA